MITIVINGFGNVGKAFAGLLSDKKDILLNRYGIDFRCAAVCDKDGAAFSSLEMIDLSSLLDFVKSGRTVETAPSFGLPDCGFKDIVTQCEPGVLIECTPTDIETGEPGYSNIRSALENGWHVITASKGPLVLHFKELIRLAEKKGLCLKYSGAAAAALPTVDIGSVCLSGAEILKIEGILNGTSNFILSRMSEFNESYEDSLKKAQELGIAETDPKLDVEGWDTASKMLILSNSLCETDLKLSDISVEGINSITAEDIRKAADCGKTLKLLGVADYSKNKPEVFVKPVLLERDHPLYNINGTEKGALFSTDTMGRIFIAGGSSNPVGAAASMLKDMINICRI